MLHHRHRFSNISQHVWLDDTGQYALGFHQNRLELLVGRQSPNPAAFTDIRDQGAAIRLRGNAIRSQLGAVGHRRVGAMCTDPAVRRDAADSTSSV